MIVLDVKQGSDAWHQAKLGLPSASNFHRIITAKTRKPSASADKLLCELLVERLLGQSQDGSESGFMLRGSELEKRAVTAYEFENDCETKAVGFVLRDDRRVGCSPDRLVGEDGLLEVKCLCARDHIAALLGMADEHMPQVQGQLWLTGRRWADLRFYNPDLPPASYRIERDEEYIADLAAAVDAFADRVDAAHAKLAALMHGRAA